MTKDELLSLMRAPEDAFVERKAEGISRRDIRKAACAFANTIDGRDGVLFIGVDDRTGAALGVRNADTLRLRSSISVARAVLKETSAT
jgi:predicted HTH transcriptional regulator